MGYLVVVDIYLDMRLYSLPHIYILRPEERRKELGPGQKARDVTII